MSPEIPGRMRPQLRREFGALLSRVVPYALSTHVARARRYPLLTTWLVILLLAYFVLWLSGIVSSIQSLFGYRSWIVLHSMPAMAGLTFTVAPVVCVWAILAILRWRRLGFYVLAATTAASVALNILLRSQIAVSVFGLLSVGILYLLLRRGTPSAWQEMLKADSTNPATEGRGSSAVNS
jgi:hypothetical protein